MKFGILGSGSWGTALVKILTDNGNSVNWWNRSEEAMKEIYSTGHNPQYLSQAKLDVSKLNLSTDPQEVAEKSDIILVAVPSAYTLEVVHQIKIETWRSKKILSAVKGILPEQNQLLNDYLEEYAAIDRNNYFAVMGPCHAEEVAAEKLSYLTFAGIDELLNEKIATCFKTKYLNIVLNRDIIGVQYAAVLKNIYAVGAGIAHGLDYGDNFLSVLIANSADEMAGFLRKAGILNAEVGFIDHQHLGEQPRNNYAASVYLGDLLVTCYSLHSRNRAFGNMVGKGYAIHAAKLEMSMVAEGYNASKCMFTINQQVRAEMPIATAVYNILWQGISPRQAFKKLEETLI